jgi:hypothetical protein
MEDKYATHLPVLKAICETLCPTSNGLEVGMGSFSTPFLCDKLDHVVSIEQQDKEWYDKMVSEIDSCNWEPYWSEGPTAALDIIKVSKFDLGFVDGHREGRHLAANLMFTMDTPTIVIHDTGLISYYMLDRLRITKGYNQYHFQHNEVHPRTSVFTHYDLSHMEVEDHHPCLMIGK